MNSRKEKLLERNKLIKENKEICINKISKKSKKEKSNKHYFIVLLLFVILLGLCIPIISLVYEMIKEALIKNFGRNLIVIITINSIFSAMIGIILWVISSFILDVINLKNKKFFFLTIIVMFTIFLLGFTNLFTLLGNNNLSLYLRNSTNLDDKIGEIKCSGNSPNLIVNEIIDCTFSPKLIEYNGNVKFFYLNGSENISIFQNKISFLAPPNLRRIGFYISGIDEKNNLINLQIENDFEFYTFEENKKRKDKLITYLLGLLGLIFISVPPTMISLRQIWIINNNQK